MADLTTYNAVNQTIYLFSNKTDAANFVRTKRLPSKGYYKFPAGYISSLVKNLPISKAEPAPIIYARPISRQNPSLNLGFLWTSNKNITTPVSPSLLSNIKGTASAGTSVTGTAKVSTTYKPITSTIATKAGSSIAKIGTNIISTSTPKPAPVPTITNTTVTPKPATSSSDIIKTYNTNPNENIHFFVNKQDLLNKNYAKSYKKYPKGTLKKITVNDTVSRKYSEPIMYATTSDFGGRYYWTSNTNVTGRPTNTKPAPPPPSRRDDPPPPPRRDDPPPPPRRDEKSNTGLIVLGIVGVALGLVAATTEVKVEKDGSNNRSKGRKRWKQ